MKISQIPQQRLCGLDITRTFKISLDVRGFFYAAPATCATQFILKARLKIG